MCWKLTILFIIQLLLAIELSSTQTTGSQNCTQFSNSKDSGVCPQLNNITNKSLFWVDIDRRSPYCYWFSVESEGSLMSGRQTWSDASFHCRRRNGTLVSIHSNHELILLRNKLTQPGTYSNTWIGLLKNISGDYVWEDGTGVDFTNWDPNKNIVKGSPDYDHFSNACVECTANDLTWRTKPCSGSSNNYFICQTQKIYIETGASKGTAQNITGSTSSTELTNSSTTLKLNPTTVSHLGSTSSTGLTHPSTTLKHNSTTVSPLGSTSTTRLTSASITLSQSSSTVSPLGSTLTSIMSTELSDMPKNTTTESEEGSTEMTITGQQKPSNSDKRLSSGAKAGISFGIVGGIIAIIAIIYFAVKRFRPNSSIVTKLENSLYIKRRYGSEAEPSVRWSRNNKDLISRVKQ